MDIAVRAALAVASVPVAMYFHFCGKVEGAEYLETLNWLAFKFYGSFLGLVMLTASLLHSWTASQYSLLLAVGILHLAMSWMWPRQFLQNGYGRSSDEERKYAQEIRKINKFLRPILLVT